MALLVGVLGGIRSGLGMGGGTIVIIFLSLFLEIEQHSAQAINIIFFIPVALVSIFINFKNNLIKWKNVIFIIIFGMFGAFIGSKLALFLNMNTLKKFFGYFLLLIMCYEIIDFIKNFNKNNIH